MNFKCQLFSSVISAFLMGVSFSPLRAGEDSATVPALWAEILVKDSASGRGLPLVELETVNGLKFVTDNAGRVAFFEPGLMGREIFFFIRSHGYEAPRDGFGIKGVRVTPVFGKPVEIFLKRTNLAERLARLTGEGRFRDSKLLGYTIPVQAGRVAGQDSILAVIYQEKVYCFWGDTSKMDYPLGLFRVAGATISLPGPIQSDSDLLNGITYEYFLDNKTGFTRAMMPLPERPEGVIWLTAVCVAPDEKGSNKLVAHYSRRKGLMEELEHGIAVFNDKLAIFESIKVLPPKEIWRHPSGHPIVVEEEGRKWLMFGSPNPNVRVPASLESILDSSQYEAFTCVNPSGNGKDPEMDPKGIPIWRWQKEIPPVDSKTETEWVKSKKIKPDQARFFPADISSSSDRVTLHSGSVRWNAFRKRWVLIAGQVNGKNSLLGEVWYAEAEKPTGPFEKAVRIVTHDRQSFYNVCHHSFLDRQGGKMIHFEGTYTNDFSGNPEKTPRYNYNQVLYRLDLSANSLTPAQAK